MVSASVLWMRLDLVFLVGRTLFGGVFWGVCELLMILGCLFANGWGCVPLLLVVWHGVSSTGACWSLSGAGSQCWDGGLWESSHWLILCGAGRSVVVQCPELGSPTSAVQAWHPARAPTPFGEVWGLLPAFSRCIVGVVLHLDVFLMYLWGARWSPRLIPPPSWRSSLALFFFNKKTF